MKPNLLTAASALALAQLAAPVAAQHQDMPGMQMPMPQESAAKKEPAPKKTAPKKKEVAKKVGTKAAAKKEVPTAQPSSEETTMSMDHGAMPMDHSQMASTPMEGMQQGEHAGHQMAPTGALGRH